MDPSESKDLAAAHPDNAAKLAALATKAHEPVREGTFKSTALNERDRRAKFGKQDQPDAPQPKPNANKAAAQTVHPMPSEGLISSKGWKIVRVSSENAANNKLATNAIDGDPTTWWHSRFSGGVAKPPHEVVIDLGAQHHIRGFVYLPRQDESWNGAIKEIEISVSDTPVSFPSPLAKATLTKTKSPQEIKCAQTTARYIQVRALSEQTARGFASIAEFGVIGD